MAKCYRIVKRCIACKERFYPENGNKFYCNKCMKR